MEWILPDQNLPFLEHLFSQSSVYNSDFFTDHSIDKLHSTTLLHDCTLAAEVVLKAIKDNKKIYIYGDYDVDGICATTILWRFIYFDLGYRNVFPYVPNRFVDGYGLNADSIQDIIDDGGKMIITVDCGVKDIELVAEFSEEIDFVITDHHSLRPLSEAQSDDYKISRDSIYSSRARAVVHPQLEDYPFPNICGAVVAWKLARGMSEQIGNPKLSEKYLQFAAIGTVGDIMPLINENRSIVSLGLNLINSTEFAGINALLLVSGVQKGKVNAETIGFSIGPRLNASGRLDSAMTAVKLLCTNSSDYAMTLAEELDSLNADRQNLTRKYMSLAEKEYLSNDSLFLPIIVGEDWPEGIVGLIAGRLTEKYYKPFIIGSRNGDTIKASARSIEELNITEALNSHSTLLEKFGGHAQAAGMTFDASNLSSFLEKLNNHVSDIFGGKSPLKTLRIDALSELRALDFSTIRTIEVLEPFGNSNKKPTIALMGIKFDSISTMGKDKQHFRAKFKNIEFVQFNFEKLPNLSTLYDVAGFPEIDTWNGREKISFKIRDIRESLS